MCKKGERRKKEKKNRAGSRGCISGVQLTAVSVALAAVAAIPLERDTQKPPQIPANPFLDFVRVSIHPFLDDIL